MLRLLIPAALLWLALPGCREHPDAAEAPLPRPPTTMRLTSPAFVPGGALPEKYTCLGAGVSPPLAWSPPPGRTESLVVTLERVDGPSAEGAGTLLWMVFNVPPTQPGLAEGARLLPAGEAGVHAPRGANDFGTVGYDGPCPPAGEAARYAFRIFALRTRLVPDASLAGDRLHDAMRPHVLARGELVATFGYATR